ncbi:MAG TPA: hypothetical protein VKS01_07950 [Bryobacteraceae bacterium]|nr:hypothetical protein [Bryobacteraceae bacterium]
MDEKRAMLKHFLAALAYRTQKALRGAPPEFAKFRAGVKVRTPHRLIHHMDSVLGYAGTFFTGGEYRMPMLEDFEAEVARFHATLASLAKHLEQGTELRGITPENLLQGPFADAMTHAGQIAMLRRLAGYPVAAENFIFAEIDVGNLSANQPMPAKPDEGWTPDVP